MPASPLTMIPLLTLVLSSISFTASLAVADSGPCQDRVYLKYAHQIEGEVLISDDNWISIQKRPGRIATIPAPYNAFGAAFVKAIQENDIDSMYAICGYPEIVGAEQPPLQFMIFSELLKDCGDMSVDSYWGSASTSPFSLSFFVKSCDGNHDGCSLLALPTAMKDDRSIGFPMYIDMGSIPFWLMSAVASGEVFSAQQATLPTSGKAFTILDDKQSGYLVEFLLDLHELDSLPEPAVEFLSRYNSLQTGFSKLAPEGFSDSKEWKELLNCYSVVSREKISTAVTKQGISDWITFYTKPLLPAKWIALGEAIALIDVPTEGADNRVTVTTIRPSGNDYEIVNYSQLDWLELIFSEANAREFILGK